MREITSHKVNGANSQLSIHVMDEPGIGGASHVYRVGFPDGYTCDINFQNGPILQASVNGLTHEVLLAILIDRLGSFQGGNYACIENEYALANLRTAEGWLRRRTQSRIDRGVEGTHII